MTNHDTVRVAACELTIGDRWVVTRFGDGSELHAHSCYDDDSLARAAALGYGNGHEAVDRMTREHDLAHARVAEALGLPHSPMLHATANGQAFDAGEADREERLALLLQRVSNQGLRDRNLAGAAAAHHAEPSADSSAPAPANTSMGAGSAPEPESALRAGGSIRGAHAPAPVETLALDRPAAGERNRPTAS